MRKSPRMKNSKSENRQATSLVTDSSSQYALRNTHYAPPQSKIEIQKSKIRKRGPVFDRRTTWERLAQIDDWIASGTCPNCRSMALKLGVTERTVMRDIDHLKNHRKL